MLVGALVLTVDGKSDVTKIEKTTETEPKVVESEVVEPKVEEVVVPKVSWKERLSKGLSRSRQEVWGKLEKIFTGETLDEDTLEEIEELLYTADIGPATAAELIDALREKAKDVDFKSENFRVFLKRLFI